MTGQKRTGRKIWMAFGATAFVGLLFLSVLFAGNWGLLKSLFTAEQSREELGEMLRSIGWRGYIATTALAALQVICAFLPAEPVQVLGGFTFGFPTGLACCMFGVLLGNTAIYMLQRMFGDRMKRFFIRKMNLNLETIASSGRVILIIFILYFLPAIPYGMICFLAASMGMSYRRYILVTGLGSLPSVGIGVSLGYVAIAADGTVTLCVFAVLLALTAVLIWKRDLLFSKVNSYAEGHKKVPKNRVRDVNGFLLGLLYYGARVFLFFRGIRFKSVNHVGKPQSPAIVLCNHGSFVDFIYAAALLRKDKPHFIAARLYFYNRYLGRLLRMLGAFPKSMFAMDMENAKNCLHVLKSGQILAMMPEARLSTVGRFEDIQGATCAFIKKSAVPVYTIKINGDYLADPKWGGGLRRGAVVEAEMELLYTAEEVKTLSLEQVQRGIEQRLYYDELQWLKQRPEIHYHSGRLAEGLENVLAICPRCGGRHTITTRKNKVCCETCGYLTSLDDRYAFDKGFCFDNFAQWYDWQKANLEKKIAENADYVLRSAVELRLPGDGKGLTRHGGNGVCSLSRDGLTYCGTKDGESVELHFSVRRIYRLLFGAGQNFEIYDGTQILYFVPEETRSAVDWYMASMLLHDRFAEDKITVAEQGE